VEKALSMQNSRLWFSTTLVSISWLGFGLLRAGGVPWTNRAPQIEVRTVPPGAEVLIDGKPVGLSDSFLDLPQSPPTGTVQAQIEIRVKKQGYEDARIRVDATLSQLPLVFLALKPKLSKLQLSPNSPKEVEVWSGPGTPVKLPKSREWTLEPGLYELWGIRDGLNSEHRLLHLKAGQSQEVNFAWPQSPRLIQISMDNVQNQ
jgi:hypothetical protein